MVYLEYLRVGIRKREKMDNSERLAPCLSKLANMYMRAKSVVIDAGYGLEIDWQAGIALSDITESDFLREAGWVILSCGMREAVIRNKFSLISAAFFEWKSAAKIVCYKSQCLREAICHFGHEGKIRAIIEVARRVFENGFEGVREAIGSGGIDYIITLPYMGPATAYHFAKNLGLPVAKPDRHLTRMAEAAGYDVPQSLCADIADITGDKISVVDLVLWRFATLERDYVSYLCNSL